ncbi:MAG: putative dsRNA-binding protein, partial [Candidatus Dormibacteraeota bacterium]|nr:putative dsRNA-binding protein [Candidatus Dormibacteraeota bacterium]
NAFEAVLGAIFLDAGYDAAYHYYLDRFRSLPEPVQDENHKGRLQQVVQEKFGQTPYYDSVSARGGRQREYTAVVYAGPEPLGTGHGVTKQGAEQDAARNALAELSRRDTAGKPGRGARLRDVAVEQPAQSVPDGLDGVTDAGYTEERAQDPSSAGGPAAASTEAAAAFEQPKPRRSRRRKSTAPSPEQPAEAPPPEQTTAPPTSSRRGTRRRRPQPAPAPDGDASQAAPGIQLGDAGGDGSAPGAG